MRFNSLPDGRHFHARGDSGRRYVLAMPAGERWGPWDVTRCEGIGDTMRRTIVARGLEFADARLAAENDNANAFQRETR